MINTRFLRALTRIAISFAVIGLLAAAQSVLAQKPVTWSSQETINPIVKGEGPSSLKSPYGCDSDFTGDHLTDIVFLNAASATWTIDDLNGTISTVRMGARDSQQVAADYDGDGVVDIASVSTRGGLMNWQILQSSDGVEVEVAWGIEGDTLVQGDFDGDGRADAAVMRPSDGFWYINGSLAGAFVIECGTASDIAVPGDYDGDGITDAAAFRSSERSLYYFGSSDQTMHELIWRGLLENRNETFVPADYDGDGKTDFAIFNSVGGVWTILESSTGEYRVEVFGKSPSTCDVFTTCVFSNYPFPGDYDNDGKADPAVWISTHSIVLVISSSGGYLKFPATTTDGMLPVSAYFMTR